MKKLVLFMHVSLDGFVAGPGGEMDWIKADDEMFDLAGQRTRVADTALYGRVTYQMMESFWPTADEQPNPSKHVREHAPWYRKVKKVVVSRSMAGEQRPNTEIIGDKLAERVRALKQQEGEEIVMFGSPSVSHALMREQLIDEYWLFVNPMVLGKGIPLFSDVKTAFKLQLVKNVAFASGVVCLHYRQEGAAK